ncbi:MAG: polysaccharide export protein [Verrucomicrobiae bacterium]|nr:polysaccharide export protein [Verrucomicrobiae bacterium]
MNKIVQVTRDRSHVRGRVLCHLLAVAFLAGVLAGAEENAGSKGGMAADGSKPRTGVEESSHLVKDYRILALDVLSISVFQEPDLTRDVKVSQTGYITFPLLGKVQVAGLLVSEVEAKLAGLLGKDYIKNPQVSVMIKEYSPRRVSVLGEVKNPGSFDIPAEERLSLLQAIARAGGFNNVAKTDAVVIRRVRGGKEEKFQVNATELLRSKGEKKDVELLPGDVVVVPTRFF